MAAPSRETSGQPADPAPAWQRLRRLDLTLGLATTLAVVAAATLSALVAVSAIPPAATNPVPSLPGWALAVLWALALVLAAWYGRFLARHADRLTEVGAWPPRLCDAWDPPRWSYVWWLESPLFAGSGGGVVFSVAVTAVSIFVQAGIVLLVLTTVLRGMHVRI
jgi:hypothetical protein